VLGVGSHGGDVLAGNDKAGLDQRLGRRRGGDDDVGAANGLCRVRFGAHEDASFSRSAPAVASALTASRAQMRASAIGRTSMSASSCSPA